MPKKDVYASIGTILTLGAILLLLLWFKLMIPSPPIAEQGIEVGYGVDPDGEVGGSSGGQRGDLAGTPDGDFYAKQIEAPSFSERPAEASKPQVSAAAASSSESSSDNTLTQDGDEVVSASSGGSGKGTADQADLERQRAAQEEARRRTAAEQQAKSSRAKSLGLSAFGNSGGSGSGGFGLGSGTGSGSGSGQGTGIGDGVGSGTKGNPFGKGTSNGNTWSLEGRNLSGTISKPTYRENVEGKITVKIRVDDAGNVISASIGSPTTIADESLRNATLESARRTKFSAGKGVVYGQIIYNFKLN